MRSVVDRPAAVDLFCGCGGLTLGLVKAGFKVVAAVEVDPLAVKAYKNNHKGVDVWEEDIQTIPSDRVVERLSLEPGELDVLAGCPPCQGFSKLRTLNGSVSVDDPRNDLILDFLRFVEVLRPKAVMLENVPRLIEDDRFALFSNRLEALGYLGTSQILNAADYGVPQRRRRLIYLAGLRVKIPFGLKAGKLKTVRDVLSGLPVAGESGDSVHDISERRSEKVKKIINHIPKDGGSRKDLPEELQLECHKRCDGFKDVYGRMAWDQVAPTITTGCSNPSKGRFLHPEENRVITLREAALLQGFPPKYKFVAEIGKGALAAMIGNALPPPFIAAHARSIRKVIEKKHRSGID